MLKRLIHKAISEVNVPTGALDVAAVKPRQTVHNGVPATATVLAYEPVQRLVALGTTDGQIKIFGGRGVEGHLRTQAMTPCKVLQFLINKGRIVQVTSDNCVEVYDLEKRSRLGSCRWETDITAIAPAPGTYYIYVGDEQGLVRLLNVEAADGILRPMSYCIPPHAALGALYSRPSCHPPAIAAIMPQPDAQSGRILLVYSNGLLALWALHEGRSVAVRGGSRAQQAKLSGAPTTSVTSSPASDEDDDEEQHVCGVCWADAGGGTIAVGYDTGDVRLWSLPPGKAMDGSSTDQWGTSGTPLREIKLVDKESRLPVTILRWCASSSLVKGGRLYVMGGGPVGEPGVITVLTLASDGEPVGRRELPWFGPVSDMLLAPVPGGDLGSPMSSLIVLASSGLIQVYDEPGISAALGQAMAGQEGKPPPRLPEPLPLCHLFRGVSATKLVAAGVEGAGLNTLLQLPADVNSEGVLPSGGKWPVSGGTVPSSPPKDGGDSGRLSSSALFAGLESGGVDVWSTSRPSMSRITCLPREDEEVEGLQGVSFIEFCPVAGLLIVGYKGGMVRAYAVSSEERQVTRKSIDEKGGVQKSTGMAGPGLQCLAVLQMHTATIQCISIASAANKVACGDENGMVSIFDLTTCTFVYMDRPFTSSAPITSLVFANLSAPEARSPRTASPDDSSEGTGTAPWQGPGYSPSSSPQQQLVLFVCSASSCITLLDACSGAAAREGAIQTKNQSKAVALHVLDAAGLPVVPYCGPISVPWAFTGDSHPSSPKASSPRSGRDGTLGRALSLKDSRVHSPDRRRTDGNGSSSARFVLLVSEDTLRLYSVHAIEQADRTALRKEKLSGTDCIWSGLLGLRGIFPAALVLLNRRGRLQVRSLPDLSMLVDVPLSSCTWSSGSLSPKQLKLAAVAPDGRLVLASGDTEVLRLSLLTEENSLGLPESLPGLHDDVLAMAAAAAAEATESAVAATGPQSSSVAATGIPERGRKKGLFGALETVAKAADRAAKDAGTVLAGALGRQPSLSAHIAEELHGLFTQRPYVPRETRVVASAPPNEELQELEVDDIDVDTPASGAPKVSRKEKLLRRLSTTKGKGGAGGGGIRTGEAEGHPSTNEEAGRSRLFSGLERKGEPPRARTVAEIRAAYTQADTMQAGTESIAETRNKLLERQEKLERMQQRTQELQNSAANFGELAKQLAEAQKNKKWYQL